MFLKEQSIKCQEQINFGLSIHTWKKYWAIIKQQEKYLIDG